jgi:uncharacterized protein YbbK (DUF523 family)
MDMSTDAPKLAVSRCLLGSACRWDGASRPCPSLKELPAGWTLLDLCPEEDVGMGIPRPSIAVVEHQGMRLHETGSRRDWTMAMESWCRFLALVLVADGLAGAVLKARSPSCGRGDVEVFRGPGASAASLEPGHGWRRNGDGFWARALREADPGLPMINDEELAEPDVRAAFLECARMRTDRQAEPGGPQPFISQV